LPFRFRSSPVTLVLVLPLAFHFSFPSLVFGVVCSRVKTRCRSTKIRFCWVDSRSGAQKEFPSRTVWRHRFPLPPDLILPFGVCCVFFCHRRCADWVGPHEQLRSFAVAVVQVGSVLVNSSGRLRFLARSPSRRLRPRLVLLVSPEILLQRTVRSSRQVPSFLLLLFSRPQFCRRRSGSGPQRAPRSGFLFLLRARRSSRHVSV
jgi:hypothetical protein